MGIFLNPGNENFARTLSAKIYVDKTNMLSVLNGLMKSPNNYVCLSRPRRFGKTIAGNMISAYYSKGCDSRELFLPYKIASDESFEENLNKFNVIKVDLNGFYSALEDKSSVFSEFTGKVLDEFIEQFSDIDFSKCKSIADCISKVFKTRNEQFVIIIDEYDVIVRDNPTDEILEKYREFLISLFKNADLAPAIALSYITGILPVMRDKIQSKLNNFDEYTMLYPADFAQYFGFTRDEVNALCEQYGVDFAECQNWYDGYKLGDYEIYNPNAVVKAVSSKIFRSYWSLTGTFDSIAEKIRMNFDGTHDAVIKMLAGESVDVDVERFENSFTTLTRDDVFTFLIHLGYLVYNPEEQQCSIPNKEVRLEWQRAVSAVADYAETNQIIQDSKELLAQTLQGNGEAVAASLDKSHIHVTSNRSYNNEYALQSAIYLSFSYALNKYTAVRELTTGKGFADIVYIPVAKELPALIIELKHNKSAESALTQIREKKYFATLSHYTGDLLFVGINYDEKTKTHECKIEKFVKE